MGSPDRGRDAGAPSGSDAPARAPGRVSVRPLAVHGDARGTVFEPLDAAGLARQRNVHVVLTEPGCVRGNHVHREATEVLVVRGPARVRFRDRDGLADVDVRPGAVTAFTIPPGVPHAVRQEGDAPGVLVAFRDREHDPGDPDTRKVELLPDALP